MTNISARRGHCRKEGAQGGAEGTLARFGASQSGNVAVLFALMVVVLLLAIGAAVDVGRWLHARDQTSSAIDAAVLAGGRVLQTNSSDTAGAIAAAEKYYAENVTSRLPVVDDSVAFTTADNGSAMTASGTAYIKTPFLQLANISRLPLIDMAEAKAQRKIGNKEVALMLDVTGSMAGQKLEDLKAAAKDLIEILLPEGQTTVKVSLVPFSEDVRLPTTSALNIARGTAGLPNCRRLKNGNSSSCSTNVNGSTDYYRSTCVVERSGTEKYTDAAPAAGKYVMAHYTRDSTGSGSNKVGKCVIPAGSEIMPLTDDKAALLAKITGLKDGGGTAGHIGTAWAWYTLSPNWGSLWSSNQPQPYDTSDLKKIAVLMTDGEYNTEYDKNGVKTGSPNAGAAVNGTANTQAAALCSAMKQKGIEVWTIGFDLGSPGNAAYQMLKTCASPSEGPSDPEKFYATATGEQLKQAFHDIGLKLSKLHLSK